MKIDKITFEMGNDFNAILECEHCGGKQELKSGYHDHYYHHHVLPAIACKACGKDRAGNAGVSENVHVDATIRAALEPFTVGSRP